MSIITTRQGSCTWVDLDWIEDMSHLETHSVLMAIGTGISKTENYYGQQLFQLVTKLSIDLAG